jgi:hypothetical protein
MSRTDILQAVAVTAELCGRTFSDAAARVFVSDLRPYPEALVIRALAKCRKQVKGTLTVQDVIARIDDGRPGPEEAWALIPQGEDQTIVWTSEMATAFGVCSALLAAGDRIGARMAFKEAYQREVTEAKDGGFAAEWVVSLGSDVEQRKRVLSAAVADGRITPELAYERCPALPPPKSLLLGLPPKDEAKSSKAREQLQELSNRKRGAIPEADPKAWAKRLRTMEQGGLRLTQGQRDAWRSALLHNEGGQAMATSFETIPEDALPPGLRKELERERAMKAKK